MKFEREIPIGLDARRKKTTGGGGGQNAPHPNGIRVKIFIINICDPGSNSNFVCYVPCIISFSCISLNTRGLVVSQLFPTKICVQSLWEN